MANQVTLTFAGDTKGLESGFDRVGGAAKDMGQKVKESGDAFDRAAERSDALDTKAMGFRDTLTGIQDGAKGIKQAAAGDWGFETLLLLGFGIGDLASGMTNFLIPALKATRIGTLAKAAADKVAAAGAKAWTAAQWLMNTALLASPLTWIVLAIAAVIVIIVIIAKKTDWFSKAWGAAWSWIKKAASNTWDWLKKVPGWIGDAFKKVANFVTAPFRFAFNQIAKLWNNTIGRLSWSVPDWVPVIGGNSISVPQLPTFHAGGIVPGVVGTAVPIMAQAGERVTGVAGAGGGEEWIRIDLGELGDALLPAISRAVGKRGGSVTALGVRLIRGSVR